MASIDGFGQLGDDLQDLKDDLEQVETQLSEAVDEGVRKTTEDIFDQSQVEVPVDTGELKSSGKVVQQAPGEWLIVYTADHAADVEYGTAPHEIVPNEADALKFPDGDGGYVFAAKVNHPGTAPQSFIRVPLDAHAEELPRNILREIERVFDEVF